MSPEESRRRPRLEDVAARAGVSRATVSLVMRNATGPSAATRERVTAAAADLGYRRDRAASALAARRGRSIGVLLEVSNPFHGQLVEDIHEAADRHGYDLVLSTVTRTRDEARAVETLLDSRCVALALLGPEAPDREIVALGRELPVVAVGRPIRPQGFDVVRAADDDGVAQTVEYLAGLGHRTITYVDGGRGAIAALRRRGYQRAMRGLHRPGEAVVVPGGHTESDGVRAARHLLDAGSAPTAVVAFNDRCALGLVDTLVRAGVSVPGQMSVVGYDDSPLARLAHVDLTTVSQNTPELTEHAVTVLDERLAGRAEDREVVIRPLLVVRGSSAPPGAHPA